jgi:hypothetical protein
VSKYPDQEIQFDIDGSRPQPAMAKIEYRKMLALESIVDKLTQIEAHLWNQAKDNPAGLEPTIEIGPAIQHHRGRRTQELP